MISPIRYRSAMATAAVLTVTKVAARHARRVTHKVVVKNLAACARHPHHYYTAACLTVFFVSVGMAEKGAIVATWGYALFENILDDSDRRGAGRRVAEFFQKLSDDTEGQG